MGYFPRRSIHIYKAFLNNEGYGLICIHSNSRKSSTKARIQAKSRCETHSDRAFSLKDKSFDAVG